MVETGRGDERVGPAVFGEQAFPGVDPEQERGPERQHHEHQQGGLDRRARAGHEVGERVADQETQHGRDGRVLQAREVGGEVEVVGDQGDVVAEANVQRDRTVLHRDHVLDAGDVHLRDADLQHDQERQQKEQQQPDVRHADHDPGAPLHDRAHDVSTTCAVGDQLAQAISPTRTACSRCRSVLLALIFSTAPLASARW